MNSNTSKVIPFPSTPPLGIQTGYQLEFTDDFDPAALTDQDVVMVAHESGHQYTRRFNRAEFKQRNLTVVGLMTAFHWVRPTSHSNQDEVIA